MCDEEYAREPKRLTQEELDKQIERLTAPQKPTEWRDPFEVCPTKHLSQGEVDNMTNRLYTQSLQQKEMKMKELEAKQYGAAGPHGKAGGKDKIQPEEMEGMVKRLYTDSLAQKNANLEQLQSRYLFHPPEPTQKVDQKTFVQHMYYDRLEAKKRTQQRLYDTYLAPTEIRTGTISKEQLRQSADRLSTSKA